MSLAWSFSWFAMKLQVDSGIPLELSVFYRFVVTSFLMFLLCFITKQRVLITRSEVKFLLLGGLFNFCLNFLLGYFIIRYIPSGVLATIFSLSIITSEIISSIIQKRKIEQKVVISSVIGVIGLAFFILPSITFGENSNFSKVMTGLGLSLVMMIIYSLGNAVIAQNKKVNQT